jgi:hypothetical protein
MSLSPVVHSRDSHTSATPTTQPSKGITRATRAMTSSHGVAGLASGQIWTKNTTTTPVHRDQPSA